MEGALEFQALLEAVQGVFVQLAGGLEGQLREVTGHDGRTSRS